MKQLIFLLSVVVSIPLCGSQRQESDSAPLTVRAALASSSAPPIWVSSRIAFDEQGRLRKELFEPAFHEILEANQKANPSGCHTALGAPTLELHLQNRTLDDLISHARTIIAARVVSADTGFYNGTPGTLLGLAVNDVPKAMGRYPLTERTAQLFIADATIPTARGTICAREPFAPALPAMGDRVLLFAMTDPIDADYHIFTPDIASHVVIEHGKRLFAPASVPTAPAARSFDDLLEATRANTHIHDAVARQ